MPYDVLARCIQGHSVDDLDDREAHVPYDTDNAGDHILVHYTNDKLLDRILARGALIPGGGVKRRNHVYISRHRVSDTGVIPDSFTKRGTNIGIALDSRAMIASGVPLFVTRAGTVLCPREIESRFFLAAKYITEPCITLWKQPQATQIIRALSPTCRCPYCGYEHFQGTQICLGHCWVPITLDGIHDHIQHIPDRLLRTKELLEVYNITHRRLQQLIDACPANALDAHTLSIYRTHTADAAPAAPKRQRTAPPPVAAAAVARPSAEAEAGNVAPQRWNRRATAFNIFGAPDARRTRDAAAVSAEAAPSSPPVAAVSAEAAPDAPPPTGAAPGYPIYGDPVVRGACSHMTDKDIYNKQKGASRRTDEFGYPYNGHSDRYRRDPVYRRDCQRHTPPTPEILFFVSGRLCD